MNVREYERNGKQVLHQSNLKDHFTCAKKGKYSTNPKYADLRKTSKPMNNGLLTESYLWGFKGETHEERAEYQEKLELHESHRLKNGSLPAGRKPVIENAIKCASIMKDHFPENEQPFFNVEYEDENFIYTIEVDSFTPDLFSDLKVTTDMPTVWGFMDWRGGLDLPTKIDMLQPIFYLWVWFKANGSQLKELPKWVFKIIDWGNHSVKTFPVNINMFDFQWLEGKLIDFQSDLFHSANPNHTNCVRNKFGAKCPYLPICYEGLEFCKGEIKSIDFADFKDV